MAGLSAIPTATFLGYQLAFDDDCDATAIEDIDSGPTELRTVLVESANAAATYLQMWDSRSPVVGTDPQDFQLPVPLTAQACFVFLEGGHFLNGLSWAMTTDKGTAASASPATPPDVYCATLAGIRRYTGALVAPTTELDTTGSHVMSIATARGARRLANAVPDATARTIYAGATTIYGMKLDNTRNSSRSYLKLWNNATPTVGNTTPDIIVSAAPNLVLVVLALKGIVLGTAATYAVLTTGGTGGTTAPVEATPVEIQA